MYKTIGGLWLVLILLGVSGSLGFCDTIDTVRQDVFAWRDAWEKRDFNRYISFYHPAFRSGKLDFHGWKKKKSKLFYYPGKVSIDLYGLSVIKEKSHAIVRFVQRYKSEQLFDTGEKNLVFEQINGRWKIISEEWIPLPAGMNIPAASGKLGFPPALDPDPPHESVNGLWEGIKFNADPGGSEKVFIRLNGFFIPDVFNIEGDMPRVVIDIGNVQRWSGDSEIPVRGRLIRRIRSFLHQNDQKLRIVLDLEQAENYHISQIYYSAENIYCLEVSP